MIGQVGNKSKVQPDSVLNHLIKQLFIQCDKAALVVKVVGSNPGWDQPTIQGLCVWSLHVLFASASPKAIG